MGGGAWPFLVGGAICLVNSDNERDSGMLTSYATPDERRGSLRKASGSRQTDFDPEMSEWGNPAIIRWLPYTEYIGVWSEPGELKHLSTLRKRNQPRFP